MNMKKLLLISMMLMTVLAMAACEDSGDEPFTPEHPELSGPSGGEDENESEVPDVSSLQVNIMVSNRTITATMEDNAATQDFLARLPLEVTLNDYNNTTEKIFYPSPALAIEGVTRGCAPIAGDITIYAPWGNVAIFCKNGSYSDTLIKIGRVDGNGIEMLSVPGDILTRVRDNILKSKEQKNIQPTKGGHKMVTCQNYVSLFYRQITSCPSDGGIS